MRFAAISDIHANLPALEAVLADIERRLGSDALIVVAGDLIGCGAFPAETLTRLRSLPNRVIIAGNHEEYVLEEQRLAALGPREAPYNTLFAPARWTGDQLTPDDLAWLTALPRQAGLPAETEGQPDVRIVHGSPRHQTECIFPQMDTEHLATIFGDEHRPGRLWICGHTHRPALHQWGDMTIANIGSTGAPYDGDPRAAYLTAEWEERIGWRVEHHRVQYDRDRTLAALLDCAAYDQAGPFMRLIWFNVGIAGYAGLSEFVRRYLALDHYPAAPDDMAHLDRAIRAHIADFRR